MERVDRLDDVISAYKSRGEIAPPDTAHTLSLISFSQFDPRYRKLIRQLQRASEHIFGVHLTVVGGGYGCFRITLRYEADKPVCELIADDPNAFLRALISHPESASILAELQTRLLIHSEPYVRNPLESDGLPEKWSRITKKYARKLDHSDTSNHSDVLSESFHRKALRSTLQDWLTDSEFEDLCFDEFPDVFKLFTTGQSRDQRIKLMIDFAEKHSQIQKLLTAINEINSTAYRVYLQHSVDGQ